MVAAHAAGAAPDHVTGVSAASPLSTSQLSHRDQGRLITSHDQSCFPDSPRAHSLYYSHDQSCFPVSPRAHSLFIIHTTKS